MKKVKKLTKVEKLQNELLCKEKQITDLLQQNNFLNAELNTIKKYTLNPIVSLQIALEKTTDCVAHVLNTIQPKRQLNGKTTTK